MLNKLGIKSTPATAATLAQEMFANELRASAMINPLSSYAQQSRGEQRLTDLVNQAKIQVESELRAIRNLPEATEDQQKALQSVVLMIGGLAISRALNDKDLSNNLLTACQKAITEI